MSAELARTQTGETVSTAQKLTNLGIENRNANNAISANNLNRSLAIAQENTNAVTAMNVSQSNSRMGLGLASNAVGAIASANVGQLIGGSISAVAQAGIDQTGMYKSADISNRTAAENNANSLATNAAMTSQANSYAARSNQIASAQTSLFGAQNYELAMKVASGDYENAIAGINAQVQQMQMTPPTTSGSAGGDSFNLANGIMGVLVRFRTCAPSALRSVGEFMLRYGYFVQRFVTPPQSLECMSKFTYWQMQEAYVRGTLPENCRLAIKGMFERGVTVWSKPEYIGVTDWADNEPLRGIRF